MRKSLISLVALVALLVQVSALSADTIAWNVGGSGNWDTTSTNWTADGGGRNDNKFVNGDTVSFGNTLGGTITLTADRAPASTSVTATSGTYTFSGSNITSGNLTKSGAGVLVLDSSYNTASGTLAVNAGTVRLGASNRIADTVTLTGSGTFDMQGFDETLVWPGASGPAIINMGNMTVKGLFQHDHNGGALSGSGSLTIDTGGLGGYVILGSANSYSGGTFVNSGGLYLYSAGTLNSTGALSVASGARFSLTWHAVNVDKTFGALSGAGEVYGSQNLTQASIFRIGNGGGSGTFSGNYLGAGSLVKMGAGIQTMSGNNTYSGNTTVSGGTLIFSGLNKYVGTTTISTGGKLLVNGTNGTTGFLQDSYTVNNTGTLGGSGTINLASGKIVNVLSGGILEPGNSPGTLTINGGLTLNNGAILNMELNATGDKIVVNGLLTGSVAVGGITLNLTAGPGYIGNYVLLDWTGGSTSDFSLSDFNVNFFGGAYGDLSIVGNQLIFLQPAPEPASLALVGLGMLALVRRRKVRQG